MENFGDRLLAAIDAKRSSCVVGLDPRMDWMPTFVMDAARAGRSNDEATRAAISSFHCSVIDAAHDLIPAVKPQVAFYEQYGIPGMLALIDTIQYARSRNLLVIIDAKRNDIGTTAQAYANAFLGNASDGSAAAFDGDALTVTPYLGGDSLLPFVEACERFGKGLFVLVKTSNAGSRDFQDVMVGDGPLYSVVGKLVDSIGQKVIGSRGYSSVGAVVGATFPAEAKELRRLMPHSVFLVPGYGAQGGKASDVAACFHPDGHGAVVNSSRGITYELADLSISETKFQALVRERVVRMAEEVNAVSRAG
jgi:orotidine-5'-phosphate decarboxylase